MKQEQRLAQIASAPLHEPCRLCLIAANSLFISSELDVRCHKHWQRDDMTKGSKESGGEDHIHYAGHSLRLWRYCHLAPNVRTQNQLVFSVFVTLRSQIQNGETHRRSPHNALKKCFQPFSVANENLFDNYINYMVESDCGR